MSDDALAYLHTLPRFAGTQDVAYRPGLDRINALMDAMGRPHEAFRSVHVAGTNGKGSTASMLAAILAAAGYRTGLHTSPHLFHVTERMRLDGQPAPAAWLEAAVQRYQRVFDAAQPSFFEATVALSLLYFAEEGADAAVVEVGLGGRLDATNVLQPTLSIITTLGRDHAELLGDTFAEIAREKGGIIKPGVPALTAAAPPEATAVLRRIAAAQGAPLHELDKEVRVDVDKSTLRGLTLCLQTPARRYDALRVELAGAHQQTNVALAVRAAELLQLSPEAIRTGLQDVRRRAGLRGRLEVVQEAPLVVADVAHNPEGLAATLAALRPALQKGGGRLTVLFGVMRDKDVDAMLDLLAEAGAIVCPVPLESERALPPEALADLLAAKGLAAGPAASVPDGLARFRDAAMPEDVLLLTGSHQVVSQLLA